VTTTSSTGLTLSQVTRRGRILVIDDDSDLTEVIQEFLVDEGFNVSVCKGGENGYACVVADQPELVMLDLRFGGEECGWRILDQLTLNPATRCLPVIVWSGAVESLRIQAPALLAQNGHFVLPKPFDLDVLLGTVEEALAHSPRSASRNRSI
jgi:DNA-binding response OmpR family regulator